MVHFNTALFILLVVLVTCVYGRDDEDARLIAARATVTVLSVSTSTTVVPSTCAISQVTTTCRGGRRRRQVQGINYDGSASLDSLSSSLLESSSDDPQEKVDDDKAKLQITIWSSVTSSFTLTATSTNTALVLSVSFMCSLPGNMFPAKCG